MKGSHVCSMTTREKGTRAASFLAFHLYMLTRLLGFVPIVPLLPFRRQLCLVWGARY